MLFEYPFPNSEQESREMNKLAKVFAAAALVGAAALPFQNAQAWGPGWGGPGWGGPSYGGPAYGGSNWGPFSSDGTGDFDMSFSGRTRGSGQGSGYGQGYGHGYGHPGYGPGWGGYAPGYYGGPGYYGAPGYAPAPRHYGPAPHAPAWGAPAPQQQQQQQPQQ